jgi:hypothetical protein
VKSLFKVIHRKIYKYYVVSDSAFITDEAIKFTAAASVSDP